MFDKVIGSIVTILLSMVPVIEGRYAIPVATEVFKLDLWYAMVLSIAGNLIPVPFIIIFIKRIFAWMRKISPKLNGLVTKLEKRAESKSAGVQKYAFWGLFILVAIPLPGTGVWTGSLVAAMLDMKLKQAFPAIAIGAVTACLIVNVFKDAILLFINGIL